MMADHVVALLNIGRYERKLKTGARVGRRDSCVVGQD
jgi:hypothetical protein